MQNIRAEPIYSIDFTEDFPTQFRTLHLIEDYHPHYIDLENGTDPSIPGLFVL